MDELSVFFLLLSEKCMNSRVSSDMAKKMALLTVSGKKYLLREWNISELRLYV
jgi:hypothetical protein